MLVKSFFFTILLPLLIILSPYQSSNKGKKNNKKPHKPKAVQPEKPGETNKVKIMDFLKKVDAKLYSLEAEGAQGFSFTVPLGKAKPSIGDKAKAVVCWESPEKATVKFKGLSQKSQNPVRMMLEPYLKDVTLAIAGIPYSRRLSKYDLSLKKEADLYVLTGTQKDKRNSINKKIELKIDSTFIPRCEISHTSRAGQTISIIRLYYYREEEGKFLPNKIEVKDPNNKTSFVYIDYTNIDGFWVRARNQIVRPGIPTELWEFNDFKLDKVKSNSDLKGKQ